MNLPKIYLSAPELNSLERELINEAIDGNFIAIGPHIKRFENEIASYVGSDTALAVNTGTAAIHLALIAAGVEAGDDVFCSTLTFAGSVNPVCYLNANPIFIDSESESWNMDPALLEKALKEAADKGKLPKAVILVHLYGQCADMDAITALCKEYAVVLIEDAAEALGAFYKGKHAGTFGDYGIYSFNGNKIITSSSGGMLVSNNTDGIDKARVLANQAREPKLHYEHTQVGYNYRMSNLLAAIGLGQLKNLEEKISRKRKLFEFYKEGLKDISGIYFMPEIEESRATHWLTCILIRTNETPKGISKDDLMSHLKEKNIEARPLWKPMHQQPLFESAPIYGGEVADALFEEGLCIPSGASLSDEDKNFVLNSIREVFE